MAPPAHAMVLKRARRPDTREPDEASHQRAGCYGRRDVAGIKYNSGPNDYFLMKQMQLARFDGKGWRGSER